jgi:hypothetical protein
MISDLNRIYIPPWGFEGFPLKTMVSAPSCALLSEFPGMG